MDLKALILGVTGQDGSYLAELLLSKGYEVHGMIRRSATGNTKNIDHILDKIHVHWGDLSDPLSLQQIIKEVNPDELYNEADQDLATRSWNVPNYNYDITASAVGSILRIIEGTKIKFLQPISSNIFGIAKETPQNEDTPHNPQSPYAVAKSMALNLVRLYRGKGVFASTAILYNHESPRRTKEYLSRKVSLGVSRIKKKEPLGELLLGDLDAEIDWGWSPEFVEAEWKILQLDTPDDFIIGTGEVHSVLELVEEAFGYAGLDYKNHVRTDPSLKRQYKHTALTADYSKAKRIFGFEPKVKFKDMVHLMVDYDLNEGE